MFSDKYGSCVILLLAYAFIAPHLQQKALNIVSKQVFLIQHNFQDAQLQCFILSWFQKSLGTISLLFIQL